MSRFDWARAPLMFIALVGAASLAPACAGGGGSDGGQGGFGGGSGTTTSGATGATSSGSGSGSQGASGTGISNSGSVGPTGGSGSVSGSGQQGSGSIDNQSGSDEAGASGGDEAGSGNPFGSGSTGDDEAGIGSGTGLGSGSSGTVASSGTTPPPPGNPGTVKLPSVQGTCPHISPGMPSEVTFSVGSGSLGAKVWAGTPKPGGGGDLILYWNGTASNPGAEVPICFDVNAIIADGGLVIGFETSTRQGATSGNTGDLYWYTSDVAYADQAVACAVQQYNVDPARIHSAGYSAGALQTVWMTYGRSNYIASAISYSGGNIVIDETGRENPGNVPPAIVAHGNSSDDLVANFDSASISWENQLKSAGAFDIDCNDGGSHLAFFTQRGPPLKPVAYKFFRDHPFGVKPEPYTSLPPGYPSYCHIGVGSM